MIHACRIIVTAAALSATIVSAATAAQSLIPSPYPTTVPGAQPLDPEPVEPGAPQTLKRDPYPQLLGNSAQGNPPIARHRRNQKPVPGIFQRKYRVDRP